jgi:superfamily II DNA/RNA helicase
VTANSQNSCALITAMPIGANLPTVLLVIMYGGIYSPENLLQAAGRAARLNTLSGTAIMICTTFSLNQAKEITKGARGVQQVC